MSELISGLKDKLVAYNKLFTEKSRLYTVIVLTMAIFIGQVVDAGAFSLEDLPDAVRDVIDPVQYMIGMMLISLILILRVIRKYEVLPNSFLVTLKWYFVILFLNDFIVLILRIIQKSNILSFTNSFSGVGKIYMVFASIRAITDLTISSVAAGLLVYGLARYRFVNEEAGNGQAKLGRIIIFLICVKVISSVPVNMTGLLTNQALFIVSMFISQTTGLAVAGLFYLMIKKMSETYKTGFFKTLKAYFLITLAVTGLTFIYSISTYSLLSRFPAGEMGSLGAFGNFVLFVSLTAGAVQNYLMYTAINGYDEGETIVKREMVPLETASPTSVNN